MSDHGFAERSRRSAAQTAIGSAGMSEGGETLCVMQAVQTLDRAGAQEVVRLLAKHLKAAGCAVTVCAFRDGPMRTEIEAQGIPVALISRPRCSVVNLPLFLSEMHRIRRELARLLEIYEVDLLQGHKLHVLDFLILSLRPTTRLRAVLWTMHNVRFLPERVRGEPRYVHRLKRSTYVLLYRLLSRYADGLIAVSDEVRASILRQIHAKGDKVWTICNGVDVGSFERPGDREAWCARAGVDAGSRLIATVGRLTEQKGHRYLIDAAPSVVARFPDARFLLVGEGELRHSLEHQVESRGLSEHIHFLGVWDDVPELLAACDLWVLPSLWEGLSVALLEAMAAAKPIVATSVSGTAQVMASGVTGLLVPPGDSQMLASAIVQLLADPAGAREMGMAAREHVRAHFSAEKQAAEHLALYHRLLHGAAKP